MRLQAPDGTELAVHDLGGDGPPLVLCHGTGLHGRVWRPVADHLADRFRVWAFDFRLHGASASPPRDGLRWDDFAVDVLAVVDGLGLDRPAGAGHSKGAAALLLAEQARPGTFRALHLFEPILFPPLPAPREGTPNSLADGAERRREVFPSRAEALAHFAARPPLGAFDPQVLASYVEHGVEGLPDGTVRLRCRGADEAQVYRTGALHDAWDHLTEVRCPTTVACGAASTSLGPDAAAAVAGRLPLGRLQVLEDRGHFAPLDDPEGAARAIAAGLLGG
jgi:pimeloyl-ACP methyl ester carboxylesterase